jgi:ABC-type lipoprotein release transport system permease subunit
MSSWSLIARGLAHHRRTHVGVVLGVLVATAVLVGALIVGDSVRASLRRQALQRIGRFDSVLACGDRFVTVDLARRIEAGLGATTCAALQLPGVANRGDGNARTGIVDVFGVDDTFFAMSTRGVARPAPAPRHALLNRQLAEQLGVQPGDEIVLRIEKPSLMPQEATMATVDDLAFAMRVEIDALVDDDEFGRFGLRASQVAPFDVFVSRTWLAAELELEGRANLLLSAAGTARSDEALRTHWTLADAELELRVGDAGSELRSGRVFLDAAIVDAATELAPDAFGVFTYFVNALQVGERVTPYSMVCGVGPLRDASATAPLRQLMPATDDLLMPNAWLADDLGADHDDRVRLRYYVMNEQLQLEEREHELRIGRVVPLVGVAADPTLMPEFPGLAEARSCTDWEPGVPVELDQLDDRDQQYWDEHRGTPKAFVSLATARSLWANRFGTLTAIRVPAGPDAERLAQLPRRLLPESVGLFFQDLRGPALAAAAPATDFGALYLGLSFFLIVAALLLTTLLFVFGIEQRAGEVGTLLAVGYEPRQVRSLFVREALLLACVGAALGTFAGIGYADGVLAGLATLWQDTARQAALSAHVEPGSLLTGAAVTILAAMVAIWWTLRATARRPAVELLATRGGLEAASTDPASARRRLWTSSLVAALAATGALTLALRADPWRATSAFFGGGALLLVASLAACRALLARLGAGPRRPIATVAALGLRSASRRPGRSLASIALLASGAFLVLAIQANRLAPPQDPTERTSGTGGFALFGRSTLPVLRDLATEAARDAYALDSRTLRDVDVVPLRLRPGDDASCLNLATAQNPQLLGVLPERLARRGAFRFTRAIDDASVDDGWTLLERDLGPNVVPAIGDGGSVAWALHKKVGDSLRYRDENGEEFDVRIVATVADSILQGNLLIADRHLRARFPSASGFRMFLVDAPAQRADEVARDLSDALSDIGLELTPTGQRLASFQSVQNTYLSIFQLLGGLGLLLGTVGLGVVVMRNALERRSELAVARALGFSDGAVRRLVWSEHALLLALGLLAGTAAASMAMIPALRDGRDLPLGSSALLLGALAASGAFWVWLASRLATRGPLLDRLRGD